VGGKGREIGKQRLESSDVMTQRSTFKFVGFKVCSETITLLMLFLKHHYVLFWHKDVVYD